MKKIYLLLFFSLITILGYCQSGTTYFDFTSLSGGSDGQDQVSNTLATSNNIVTSISVQMISEDWSYDPYILYVVSPSGVTYNLGPSYNAGGATFNSGAISEPGGSYWRIAVYETSSASGSLARVQVDYTYTSPPVANDDGTYSVNTGDTISQNVLTNDTDSDGDDLDVVSQPALSHGSFNSFDLETGDFVYLAPTDWAGTFNFNYTVTDGTTTDIGTVTIEVVDTIDPVANTKDTTVYLNSSGTVTIDYTYVNDGSTDNIGITNYSLDNSTFGCAYTGTNVVNLTVYDAAGNSDSKSATVTVLDTTSPTAICQPATIYLDENGMASIDADAINNGSSDACGIADISLDSTSFDCGEIGENTVVLTVTDVHSNQSTCSTTVTVVDDINPIAVTNDTTLYLDVYGQAILTPVAANAGSSDNCSIDTMYLSRNTFDCGDVGYVPMPVAVGLKSAEKVEEPGSGVMVSLTVEDGSGNSDTDWFSVTVLDTVSPDAKCKDTTIYLDETGSITIDSSFINNGSDDACGIADLDLNKTFFTGAEVGENTVTLTVTDNNSNLSTCSAIVTVVDTFGPYLSGQSIDVYLYENGEYTLTEDDFYAMVDSMSDYSTPVEDILVAGYPIHFNCIHVNPVVDKAPVVQLVARDKYRNETKTWVPIRVLDTIVPQIEPVADVEVEIEEGSCDTTVSTIYPEIVASDNCEFELEQIAGLGTDGIFPIGSTTETWVATDKSGNADTLTFLINVTLANAAPTIDEISDVEVDEDSGPVVVELSGISYGIDCREQGISLFAGIDSVLVDSVSVAYASGDSTGTITYYLAPDMFGDTILSVSVRDGKGGVKAESFRLTVNPVNDAPVLLMPIPDQVVHASFVLEVPVSSVLGVIFDDIDDDELEVELMVEGTDTLPGWATMSGDTLVCEPTIADTGCVNIVVMATDTSGATVADTFEVCVDGYPTAVGDIGMESLDVEMYPNPTKGMVDVDISSGVHEVELAVIDIMGRVVLQKQYSASENVMFDMNGKVAGMYFVHLNIDGEHMVKKLIVDNK